MWIKYNDNPTGRFVGDCAVRAVSVALGTSWEEAFEMLAENAYQMGDMPSRTHVQIATQSRILPRIIREAFMF